MERFWSKVDKSSECWEWQAEKNQHGYGGFYFLGKKQKAHRVSWQLTYGDIPDGQLVLHTCDNPSCVNPLHLWLGTQDDNMKDCAAKGRTAHTAHHGQDNPMAKLSNDMAAQIYLDERRHFEIAESYEVSSKVVGKIKRGELWTNATKVLPKPTLKGHFGRDGKPEITPELVQAIRNATGKERDVGREFGVGGSTVGRIRRREGKYAAML